MHTTNLIITALALSLLRTHAQSAPTLNWSLMDGLGGISMDGQVAMVGTISPEDAGLMVGMDVSLHSLFDPWPGNLSPLVAPMLHISNATNDTVIQWSGIYPRFQLEQTTTLTNWTAVSQTAVLSNFEWRLTVPATNITSFYRLRLFSE